MLDELDYVVTVHPKDYETLPYTIASIFEFTDARNVIVISSAPRPMLPGDVRIRWFDESLFFPFSKQDVERMLRPKFQGRMTGWYFQQLIKLYCWKYIPGCSKKYVIVDGDTIIMRPLSLRDGSCTLFPTSDEYHTPYFEHMQRMHPSLTRYMNKSGIAHMMLFDSEHLQSLFSMVSTYHGGIPFWRLFVLLASDHQNGASEYEMYSNYCVGVAKTDCRAQRFEFVNSAEFSKRDAFKHGPYSWVSFHAWIGRK